MRVCVLPPFHLADGHMRMSGAPPLGEEPYSGAGRGEVGHSPLMRPVHATPKSAGAGLSGFRDIRDTASLDIAVPYCRQRVARLLPS